MAIKKYWGDGEKGNAGGKKGEERYANQGQRRTTMIESGNNCAEEAMAMMRCYEGRMPQPQW